MTARKNIIVIGSGFAGLSAAGSLALQGHRVTVLEKNEQPGGRARVWEKDGFVFDMGPSWYWMPEVFEQYFNLFGKSTKDFYQLVRLNPSYRIFLPKNESIDVPASIEGLMELFESKEPRSAVRLTQFLQDAQQKYEIAMTDYVYRISDSVSEFLDWKFLSTAARMQLFGSFSQWVRKNFTHPTLISILEFPVLFLGATPQTTPALYSMINYADMVLGTWYPIGGMNKIIEAMVQVAREKGVQFEFNREVKKIEVSGKKAKLVYTAQKTYEADAVIAGSDYRHTEQILLDAEYRRYDETYWQSRTMSPSALIFYLGIKKKIKNLLHHNLFFDEDLTQHATEIYERPQWPSAPLFYTCVPSKTDTTVAPEGMENLFLLMPLAPGINDNDEMRQKYLDIMLNRLEARTGEQIKAHIVVRRSYCINDFEKDYHSFKGNAYGLANTLAQTAVFKPKMKSKKVSNLFYTGQLTVPGPGVPPSIISGRIAANATLKYLNNQPD